MGVFPEHVHYSAYYPASGRARPARPGRMRRSAEDYEKEGRRFYRMAAEHPTAEMLELAEVFGLLGEYFHAAAKPLNFISEHYLHYQKHKLFPEATH